MEQKMSLFDQKLFSFLEKSVLKSLVLLTAVLLTMSLSAQNTRKIQGKVVDEQNNPIIGATIVVKDAPTIGTVTDIDGNFSLSIPVDKHVIVVSYIGMVRKVEKGPSRDLPTVKTPVHPKNFDRN